MATAMLDEPMVRTMAEKKRTYGPAKVDVQALTLAKKAAAMLDKTLADYLSDLVFEHAPHDIQVGAARLAPRSPRKEK